MGASESGKSREKKSDAINEEVNPKPKEAGKPFSVKPKSLNKPTEERRRTIEPIEEKPIVEETYDPFST